MRFVNNNDSNVDHVDLFKINSGNTNERYDNASRNMKR